MKRKNLFLSLFCLGMMTMASITFMSCGDDDKEDEYKPVLLGNFRTPYIHYQEKTFWVGGTGGISGLDTGHEAVCTYHSGYIFKEGGVVTAYTLHHKSCANEHKMAGDIILNPILDSNGDTLDWYMEGNGKTLSYTIDYEKNKVFISNGEQYNLKSADKATYYESLLDDKGNAQYVLGSITDEKYNNVHYFNWLSTLN